MDALKKGGLFPTDKFVGYDRLKALKYDGSLPRPDC